MENNSKEIEAAAARVGELRRLSAGAPPIERGLLQEVFAELESTIEELRVAEEELRQQNQQLTASRDIIEKEKYRYQSLFEFAPMGYLVTDTNAVIIEANSAAAVLLNMSAKYLKGKPLANFISEEHRRKFRDELLNIQKADYIPEWELQIEPRRASAFDAAATVGVIRDKFQNITGLHWLLRDISEQKYYAAQMQNQNQT